jgi:hypothetical protein
MYTRKNKQIRLFSKIIGCLLVACVAVTFLCSDIFTPIVSAADMSKGRPTNVPKVTFKVKQSLMYDGVELSRPPNLTARPPKTVFTYRLSPKTASAPMPEGSDSEGYAFSMEGISEKALLPIEYDSPGVYVYELYCITEDDSDYEIDKRTYTIEEHVTDDLQVSMVVYVEEGVKMSGIDFTHEYLNGDDDPEEPEEPANPNRPGNNNERPNRPQSPSSQGKIGKNPVSSSPGTGDFSNPAFWIMVIAISCLLLLVIVFAERRHKERQKK